MNSRTNTKRVLFAFFAVLACALTFTSAKDRFTSGYVTAEESDRKGVRRVKSPLPVNTPTFSASGQGPASLEAATGQSFTGRAITNEEAVKLADSIIVGKIVDLGGRDVGARPGQTYYGNVKVEIVQTIKGKTYKTVTLSLRVQEDPEEEFEETPGIDNTYILFLKKLNPKDTKGIKLIEATEENLTTISTLASSTRKKN